MTEDSYFDFIVELVDREFPKGISKERGHALVLIAEILHKLKSDGIIE